MTDGYEDLNDEVLGYAVMTLLDRHDPVSAQIISEELLLMARKEADRDRKSACIWMASWIVWLEDSLNYSN